MGMEGIALESLQGYFSVAVAAFLLLRLDTDLKGLTVAIERLRRCQTCKHGDGRTGEGKED